MGMNAPRTKKSYLLTVVMVLGLAGCSGLPALRPVEQVAMPITSDEIPDIHWPAVRTVHWLVADYTISPKSPLFQSGQAYRLVIRNTGDRTHVLDGQDFFNALAIKSLTMSAFAGHTGDEHVDEPIGPKGQNGVPILPVLIDTASPPDSEADGEDSANPFAADDKEGDGETAGQSSAANPFAEEPTDDSEAPPAKEPVDTDVKVKGPAAPEPTVAPEPKQKMAADDAAKSEPETIIEDAADDDVDDPAEVKKVASDTDIDDAADDKPTASPDDDVAKSDDDRDLAADDDKDVAADDDKETKSTPAGEAWTHLQIAEITIEAGHETTLEFVAIRPGRYPLSSAHVLPTVFGMFTLATIEAPTGETKTAKAETAE